MATSKLVINFKKIAILSSITGLFFLSACAQDRPKDPPKDPAVINNACKIFQKNPSWYWEALNTYHRWGVPISVQMAIMQRESDFQSGAKPPHKKILGIIPTWNRVSSAYGYAQVLNGTWRHYQEETQNYQCYRDQFGDASDFIGWYSNKAHQKYGIRLNDAYHLYLVYHEGLTAYGNQTYLQKPWLLNIAKDVQAHANVYRKQIRQCKYSIPKVNVN